MYKKINTKLGSRMIATDEQGRLTYEGVKEFMNAEANRGFSYSTVCDGPGVYRVTMSHLAVPYTVEEIGECEAYTDGYSLAFVKAFKRLLEIELPLYCDEIPEDEEVIPILTPAVSEPKEEKKPEAAKVEVKVETESEEVEVPVEAPVVEEKEESASGLEVVKESVSEPAVEDIATEEVKELAINENSEEYIQTLESTYITIGKDLKANPKTIKELCDEELTKPKLGMIGFIARKVTNNSNEENLRQANLVREYLALKNIEY